MGFLDVMINNNDQHPTKQRTWFLLSYWDRFSPNFPGKSPEFSREKTMPFTEKRKGGENQLGNRTITDNPSLPGSCNKTPEIGRAHV